MTYNEILRYFPRRISTSLEEVFKQTNYVIEEIRLRRWRDIKNNSFNKWNIRNASTYLW